MNPKLIMAGRLSSVQEDNVGLVKLVVESQTKRNVQRLTQTYLTLSLEDIAAAVNLPSATAAELVILRSVQVAESAALPPVVCLHSCLTALCCGQQLTLPSDCSIAGRYTSLFQHQHMRAAGAIGRNAAYLSLADGALLITSASEAAMRPR